MTLRFFIILSILSISSLSFTQELEKSYRLDKRDILSYFNTDQNIWVNTFQVVKDQAVVCKSNICLFRHPRNALIIINFKENSHKTINAVRKTTLKFITNETAFFQNQHGHWGSINLVKPTSLKRINGIQTDLEIKEVFKCAEDELILKFSENLAYLKRGRTSFRQTRDHDFYDCDNLELYSF